MAEIAAPPKATTSSMTSHFSFYIISEILQNKVMGADQAGALVFSTLRSVAKDRLPEASRIVKRAIQESSNLVSGPDGVKRYTDSPALEVIKRGLKVSGEADAIADQRKILHDCRE